MRRFVVVACAFLAVAGVAALGASTALASEFTWGSPTMIEHEAPYSGFKVTAVSCPRASYCVAVNSGGDVSVSTDPTGGTSDWSTAHVDTAEGGLGEATARLTGVSCTSDEFCVAVDSVGNVWVSKDPGGGETAWTKTASLYNGGLDDVSCQSTTLCVAVGGSGYVYETTEPTGGASAWREAWVDEFRRLETVSCVTGLCLAADESGKIFTSTNPAAGLASWHETHIDTSAFPELHATCVSAAFCVATDWSGNVLTSTEPTAGASAWHSVHLASLPFFGVSCGTEAACVAVTDEGEAYSSTTPTGSASAWKEQTVGAEGYAESVECVGTGLCVVGDADGGLLTSTDPVGASPTWAATAVDGVDSLAGVSCVTATTLCVAVDARGRILSTTNAEAAASGWTGRSVSGVTHLTGVTCPSTALCVASGEYGVVTSTNPTGPSSAWTFSRIDPLYLVGGVSCPSASLCVAFDYDGDVLHSTNPAGGASDWSSPEVLPGAGGGNVLFGISCPSEKLCVAGSSEGDVYTTTNPTGAASTWTRTELGVADQFGGLSCPTTSLCVGVNGSAIIYSTDPAGGVSAWHREELPDFALGREQLEGVSCASAALCAVYDDYGSVYTSTEPAAGAKTWTPTQSEPRAFAPSALSCFVPGVCAVGDQRGDIVVGKPQSETELKTKEEEAKKAEETKKEEEARKKAEEEHHENHEEPKGGSGGGSGITATTAQVTTPAESTPVPVVGQRQTVSLVSGTVLVRLKGSSRFVSLSAASSIPDGSEVDATNGRVIITVATPTGTESAEAYGGRFVLHQEHAGSDETHFVLSLPLTGCPRVALPRGSAVASAKRGPKSRHLWVSEHGGSWGTNGRYVSTTVEGTRWLTQDECNQSEVQVAAGKVKVHDLVHNKTKTLAGGQHYTAKRH
jgi:hypothetical protein